MMSGSDWNVTALLPEGLFSNLPMVLPVPTLLKTVGPAPLVEKITLSAGPVPSLGKPSLPPLK
jgi:hypothetical protein